MRLRTHITHISFLLYCQCLVAGAFAQTKNGNKFHLSGRIYGKDTGIVVLWYKDKTHKAVADTVRLRRGQFKFSGTVRGACEGLLWTDMKAPHLDHHSIIRFILEPRSINILKVYDHPKVTIRGSYAQAEKDTWDSYKSALEEKKKTGFRILDSLEKAKLQGVEQVKRTVDSIWKALSDLDIAYAANHPNSFLSGFLLQRQRRNLPVDSLQLLYTAFADSVKQSTIGQVLLSDIYQMTDDTAFMRNNPLYDSGFTDRLVNLRSVHDFRLPDLSGNLVDFSAFKGKYLLIDVWASWCKPCIRFIPVWNRLAKQYDPKKIQFISVSLDIEISSWKQAVQQHRPEGVQVIDSGGIWGLFGVYCKVLWLPRYVLVDPEGRILHYDADQEGEEAWRKFLDDLLHTAPK